MRIISKFRDYYDSAMAYGQDDRQVWVRNTTEMTEQEARDLLNSLSEKNALGIYLPPYCVGAAPPYTAVYVGFCGKVYAGLIAHSRRWGVDDTVFWSADAFLKWTKDHDKDAYLWLNRPGRRDHWIRAESTVNQSKTNFENLVTRFGVSLHADDVFVDLGVPIFVVVNRRYEATGATNPQLKQYGFASMVDPYSAFQELSMFIGNQLPLQQPDLIEISDKDRIQQHGFNKQSFRHPVKISKL